MASVSIRIRRMLETIGLVVILCGVLFFIRETLQLQFPLQILSRGPDLLMQRFFAQHWILAVMVLVVGTCVARIPLGMRIAAAAAQLSRHCLRLVRARCPVEPAGRLFGQMIGSPRRATGSAFAIGPPRAVIL